MKQLWSPWRSEYIQSTPQDGSQTCFLCECGASNVDLETLVVASFPNTFVVMNKFPYNAGHLLVVPKLHHADLAILSGDIASELMINVQLSLRVIQKVMKPHGTNVGINLGSAAGAGVPNHLHIHIVPRWNGDTNFMPVVGDIKVVSESLTKLWYAISTEFQLSMG